MKKYLSIILAVVMLFTSTSLGITALAVEPEDIAGATVTLEATAYTYTGSAIEPAVTVEFGGNTLTADTDYTVEYASNTNAGTADVTVSGTGNYTGTASAQFAINPVKLSNSSVSYSVVTKSTAGKAAVYTLKYNGVTLKEGTDYDASYSGYSKAGAKVGKAVYTGKGNFTGEKKFSYNVYPNKVTGMTTKKRELTSLTITWNSQKSLGADGYRIYSCDSKGNNRKYIKSITTNSATMKDLKAGTLYYYVVRAYVNNGDSKIYGDYSALYTACTKVKKVTLNSVSKTKDKKNISVKWNKVACTGYEIQYSTDKSFKKGVKTVTINSAKTTSKKISVPKSDKVYYARVRAFKTYNSGKNRINGAWSTKLSSSYSKLYASYSTHYVNNPPRTNNLRLACKAINGTVVYPGQTFSFNKTVGKRTEAKGYKPAPIFASSTEVRPGVGGGVCQVATTMFNTALLANCKIVERHQHSQRVHYGQLGRDAAIYWGSEDMKWKNTTNYPIKIKMWCKNGTIHCNFYVSYDVKPKKVKLKVTRNGNNFKLTRSVGGKVNYTTRSTY